MVVLWFRTGDVLSRGSVGGERGGGWRGRGAGVSGGRVSWRGRWKGAGARTPVYRCAWHEHVRGFWERVKGEI